MQVRTVLRGLVITTVLAVLAALLPQLASAGPRGASARYLVVARSSADYSALRAKAVKEGARVIRDLPQANTLVVNATASARSSLAADRRTVGVARSQVRRITAEPSSTPNLSAPGLQGATRVQAKAPAATTAAGINPDPAFDYKGLLWDYRRIGLPRGWKTTAGSGTVTVGVADTGLDFTHRELRNKVKRVIDFTGLRRLRRRPGRRVRRAGEDRLERPRVLDRRSHRRRAQRHRHQRDRPQGQPGRPQDLPVVRLGQRRRAAGRVHHRRQPQAGHRQHLLRGLHRHLHPGGRGDLPGLP
jgi:hypothetical protein